MIVEGRQRVAIIEPRCLGLEHVAINAAMTAAVLSAFPDATVDLYGEAAHLEEIQSLLLRSRAALSGRVVSRPLGVPPKRVKGWQRFLTTRRLFDEIDLRFRQAPPAALVLATTEPAGLALLKSRLLTSWKGLPTLSVLHELLATLTPRHHRSSRWWELRAALGLPHPRSLTYLVLAESILVRLGAVAPHMARRTVAIDLPSLLGEMPDDRDETGQRELRFGFVGGGRDAKGFSEFVEIASAVLGKHPEVRFEVVGSVPADFPHSALANLTWSAEKLPFPEFVGRLRELSHVIWVGDSSHYELVASGSLADTIAVGIPVICQRGPFVDHLFNRFGAIGVRCSTIDDMVREVIRIISNGSPEEYGRQKEALRTARVALAPEACASVIRSTLAGG